METCFQFMEVRPEQLTFTALIRAQSCFSFREADDLLKASLFRWIFIPLTRG